MMPEATPERTPILGEIEQEVTQDVEGIGGNNGQGGQVACLSRSRKVALASTTAGVFLSWGILYSVQPPIYPKEAEARGATPSQYGFVFGIAHLASFLFTPVFATYEQGFGPKNLYGIGYITQSLSGGIIFSFLTDVWSTPVFIGLSYLLRFVYGSVEAGSSCIVLGMVTKLFPEKANMIMSWTESMFGLGYVVGPALGSYLYSAGDFQLPFLLTGILSFTTGTLLFFSLPNSVSSIQLDPSKYSQVTLSKVLRLPLAALAIWDNTVVYLGCGFVESMLEPHARNKAKMTTEKVGLSFLLSGLLYMVLSPVVGQVHINMAVLCYSYMRISFKICDKYNNTKHLVSLSLLGQILLLIGKVLIGPISLLSPYLDTTEGLIFVSVTLEGVAYAFSSISTFARIGLAMENAGYGKDDNRYTVSSGAWFSSFYLGSFLGATISGPLVDGIGFSDAGAVFGVLHLLLCVTNVGIILHQVCQNKNCPTESQEETGN